MRRRLAGFVRTLRDNGFAVGLAETRDALAILASPAAARPALLKPALRALFCATHADWQRFDEIFDAFWQGRGMRRMQPVASTPSQRRPSVQHLSQAATEPSAPPGPQIKSSPPTARPTMKWPGRASTRSEASKVERLTTADLRHIVDPQEIAQTHALAERLAHACGRGWCGASRRAGAAAGSICGAPSTAASRMAARRSISSGAAAR